jgi:ATP-binding cassette subfamily B protein
VSLFKTCKRALFYLCREKQAFLLICITNIILAIISIAEPILFGRIIDDISRKCLLFKTLGIWISFSSFNIIAYVLVARGADRLTHRQRLRVMTRSFDKIINMPLSWHQQHGTSTAVHTLIRATDSLSTIWLEFMRQHISTFVTMSVLVPTAMTMDWRLSTVLLILGITYSLIARIVMRKTKDGQTSIEHHHHTLFEHISDSVSNVTVVQGYNCIKEEVRSLYDQASHLLEAQYPILNWWALANGLNRIASTLSMLIVLILGTILVMNGELRVGDVVAFIGFAQLMISRIEQISSFMNLILSAHARLEAFFKIEDSTEHILEPDNLPDLSQIKGAIQFDHVTYEFGNSGKGISDISFTVQAGKTVAIVGPTGAGKTTIINLLQRVYDPSRGQIKIDGIDICTISRKSLRKALATVFQDPGLFNRSINENIRIGQKNATKLDIQNAAKIAAAHDFIIDKFQGYSTVIGERGSQLSGGEKQRIAIARAILKNSPILILDEATSALDLETERQVKDSLERVSRNRTTIIIAHRLSTVRNADLVLFIEHGKLVEKGSFHELASQEGRFRALLHAGGLLIDEARGHVIPFLEQDVA